MARGFESKDVEFQQAEAARAREPVRTVSSQERARAAARHTVELALVRARAERLSTASPIRREMLARAIADLERQLTFSREPSRS
ncbi:MAG: hypothetical protein AB7N65_00180 [Vicinamibacterales bacterium]